MITKVKHICAVLDQIAPPSLQESYDNAGLLVGNPDQVVTGVLVALDAVESVIDEVVERNCNMLVVHHPVIFKGIKSLTGANYVERTVIKAIQNNIAIFAIHTNLDSVINGVNQRIADKIGLKNIKILAPSSDQLLKLVTFVPQDFHEAVRESLFNAGAGSIGNYDKCSFSSDGVGSFRAGVDSKPYVGNVDELHLENEVRLEVVLPRYLKRSVVAELLKAHPYEEVAYDLLPIENECLTIGAGMFGELNESMPKSDFLKMLSDVFHAKGIRYTSGKTLDEIKIVALCGGSGSFLLNKAIAVNADVFVSSDFKYHDFFDAEERIMIADIGHFESEQFTKNLIHELLTKKFSNFATHLSLISTNPIKYL